jgi:hypothetical protein
MKSLNEIAFYFGLISSAIAIADFIARNLKDIIVYMKKKTIFYAS